MNLFKILTNVLNYSPHINLQFFTEICLQFISRKEDANVILYYVKDNRVYVPNFNLSINTKDMDEDDIISTIIQISEYKIFARPLVEDTILPPITLFNNGFKGTN